MNASVASMIYKFNMGNIDILQSLGYQVDVACNFDPSINPISKDEIDDCKRMLEQKHCRILDTSCPRSVTDIKDMRKTYLQLKKIADREKYDLVHTQSPIGGVLCRLAFRKAREKYGTRVIYQAHGFHFYKGAPKQSWLIYYPIEKYCSKFTDTLITINKEDYQLAKDRFYCKDVQYVPGVGIDTSKFGFYESSQKEQHEVRNELDIPVEAIWILSVGELNENKNHETVIRAIAGLPQKEKGEVFYTIAGTGDKQDGLQNLINELNLQNQIKLLGFREDMPRLYDACDVYLISSYREGLNVSLMEAMSSGLPVIASRIRGNVDLVDDEGGELFDPRSAEECKKAIKTLLNKTAEGRVAAGLYNRNKIKHFDSKTVEKAIKEEYEKLDASNIGGGNELAHLKALLEIIKLRESLGVGRNDTMLLSVGELSERKNHEVVVKALGQMKHEDIKYFIAGQGPLEGYLNDLIRQNGLDKSVKLLGFRDDVNKLTKATDKFIFPSLQEGLPVALMEAMATGLPVVASKIRGNTDIVKGGINGYLVDCQDVDGFAKGIEKNIRSSAGVVNMDEMKDFSIVKVQKKMIKIYKNYAKY